MQVLMVGAPTMLVKKYQKILLMAGLTINSMETEILSTIRSLVLGENFPPTLIISIGAVSTSFAIVRNGVMVFTYSMSMGGAAINRAIATDFGLTPVQAEEYKKVYGVSGKSLGGKIGQATEPILNSILMEAKKSLAFYAQKYKDTPIRQILLSGGTAKLPGIEIFFANNSGIETAIANPWKVLSSQAVPKAVLDNASDYTIAVGLAMRNYE
jgi:type IV pilus assembly protein PilM